MNALRASLSILHRPVKFPALHFPGLLHFSFVSSSAPVENQQSDRPFVLDYLTRTCGLSDEQAVASLRYLSHLRTSHKPDSVIRFLLRLGFSRLHIRDAVRGNPRLLVADVEKTLRPKLELFESLGICGLRLGKFISKNPTVLTASLLRRLVPAVGFLKSVLHKDEDVIKAVLRCKCILTKDIGDGLGPNIAVLKEFGVPNSQIAMLLTRDPLLLACKHAYFRTFVQKVEKMGVSSDSGLFVYAIYTVRSMSSATLDRKIELLKGLGFSAEDVLSMFRRVPSVFRTSEKKLKEGIEFFMKKLGCDVSVLVADPRCLMHSVDGRLVPRYRVVEMLRSKMLTRKERNCLWVFRMSETEFLKKYIFAHDKHAQELLELYYGCRL
ncbi:uncharacterized protein LOC116258927 [Nymphaea colorata]|uniref:Uncharacterized protein n=1 Tax=Nymphaea colorata TaxID=210225 RepID=A0A5K1FR91_9MAGN|nr:uncharacterized protein LOC116258927 [Nymphaea colorata]XP_049934925.1 uncharacterized protein LOC116258927 [Nymphaea colorata]